MRSVGANLRVSCFNEMAYPVAHSMAMNSKKLPNAGFGAYDELLLTRLRHMAPVTERINPTHVFLKDPLLKIITENRSYHLAWVLVSIPYPESVLLL